MDPSEEVSNLSWMDPSDFSSHALSTPQRLHFRVFKFIGIRHCFLNCPYFFLKELPRSVHFGLFDSLMYWVLMYWVLVSEKFCSQQDSNLVRKTPSDFESDALTTRPWLHDGVLTFICVRHSLLNCCVNLYFLKVLTNYLLLGASDRSMSSVV